MESIKKALIPFIPPPMRGLTCNSVFILFEAIVKALKFLFQLFFFVHRVKFIFFIDFGIKIIIKVILFFTTVLIARITECNFCIDLTGKKFRSQLFSKLHLQIVIWIMLWCNPERFDTSLVTRTCTAIFNNKYLNAEL